MNSDDIKKYRAILTESSGAIAPTKPQRHPLQQVIDYATQKGYAIKFSPKRTKARFIHKKLGLNVVATLYRDALSPDLWVHFNDEGSVGMSGNDPADAFFSSFKELHRDAVANYMPESQYQMEAIAGRTYNFATDPVAPAPQSTGSEISPATMKQWIEDFRNTKTHDYGNNPLVNKICELALEGLAARQR
jgi:hypothetical protein